VPTYTENHVLLSWGGPAYSGQEEWNNSVRLKAIGGDSVGAMRDNIDQHKDDLIGAVTAYFQRPTSGYAGNIRLGWVRANVIAAATGKYATPNDPVFWEIDPTVASPGSTGVPQVAHCITLRSSLRRGPAARGRWYVPSDLPIPAVTGTGVMSATLATARATSAAEFLGDLAEISDIPGPDAFVPWLYGSGAGGPVDAPIVNVQCGNVYDTQRRRRNSIIETFYEGPYDPVNG
jgi:hypothetical protein